MSQTDKRPEEAEEIILDAEVLSEEMPQRPASNLPKLILIGIVGFGILGGIFWSINQQFTQQLQQQTQQATTQGAQNGQNIQSINGQIGQLIGQIESQRDTTNGFNQKLKQQRQGFDKLQTQLESSLQKQEQMVQQLLHSNREQSRQLSQSVAALARRVDRRESNLHTAAALRLLQIAEEQLMIVRDLETTQQALAQAGQQITASGDPILLPIQEQIQQELKQVRATNKPDLPTILEQLQQAMVLSATLPFNQPDEFEQPTTALAADNEASGWSWEAIRDKVWNDLLTLVRIDKQENELPVIATRSEEQLSHLILRLRLEQAQSALIVRDTKLFRNRIHYALEWLPVFDVNSSATTQLQQQLEQLLQLELQPTLPTIGEAHRRLREIVAQRSHQKTAAEEKTEEAKP